MRKFFFKNYRWIVTLVMILALIGVVAYLRTYGYPEGCANIVGQTDSTDLPVITTEEPVITATTPPEDAHMYIPSGDNKPTGPQTGTETDLHTDIQGLETLPVSNGYTPYVEINHGIPFFTSEDKSRIDLFEEYSELDDLKRCGVAYANVCKELMPTEKRGSISNVKPSGWVQASYPGIVDGNSLYNRCHLIGFQLAGENANKKNLITGTRYLNVTGMLVFENQVAEYVKETDNHVLYRVTPVFVGEELVARGVLIEAYSVEDKGELQFCVYCFNIQPDIGIDYLTGESWIVEE